MPEASPSRSEASVDAAQVEHLADLSRLSLAPEEAERLRGEIASILDYFSAIGKVEVPPSAASPEGEDAGPRGPREDTPRPSTPDAILEGVPQKRGRYVKAPRVF